MKRSTLLQAGLVFLLLLCMGNRAFAQKDRLEGLWYNEEKTAKIDIYKGTDGKFWGKIAWLKEPEKNGKPKTDENNPKEAQRNNPLLGLAILRHFDKDGENTYKNGEVYDPKNGKVYSCKITYNGNTLTVRGYVGISMLGRSATWERVNP